MTSPLDHQATSNAAELNDLELKALDATIDHEYTSSGWLKPLTLPLLIAITDGLSEARVIGKGGFAVVYKGILGNGTAIAVKSAWQSIHMSDKEFKDEIKCLENAKHKNIVRFLGYCAEERGNFGRYNGEAVIVHERQRLLCFEYLSKGSLRDYITGGPFNLGWRKCYQIIKGICQGLQYLHDNQILHLDLKPENVLLDDLMVPKISDFGLSMLFENNQTAEFTSNVCVGTRGYMAPEYIDRNIITIKSDIYSLGIIITEVLTGRKDYPDDVEDVVDSWRDWLVEEAQFEQLRLCINIGIQCHDSNPAIRPATQTILERLQETVSYEDEVYAFDVHPRVLYFPRATVTLIPSSLCLTNNTDEHVAFRLVEKPKKYVTPCFDNLPLYGIVAPRSTYSIVVRTDRPREEHVDLILESSTLRDAHILETQCNPILCRFFEEEENAGSIEQKVVLKAVAAPQPEVTALQPEMNILSIQTAEGYEATCFDANPTKKWVITGHKKGYVRIWSYDTEIKVHSFKVSYETVNSVKFIERMKWFMVASDDGFIHVYNYETNMYKITSFRGGSIVAVHPSEPYMLSASYSQRRGRHVIGEIWDWDRDWERTENFEIGRGDWPFQVAFDPRDTNAFAISFRGKKVVEVRTLDSPRSSVYTLSGHIGGVNCLDFFTHDDQQYLITGSDDCSAKIWDRQNCVYTLQASGFPIISVLFDPNNQILITGSKDGTIFLWSSTTFRLEGIIKTGASSERGLWGLAYLTSSIGVLIFGGETDIAMMEEYWHIRRQFITDIRPGDSTTTDQKIQRDSELLDVHPLDIHFPSLDHSTEQMVHLRNKTDERVAFRLLKSEGDSSSYDLYAIIPSRCTYTLVLTAERLGFEGRTNFDLLLQSIISGDKWIMPLQNISQCNELFEELLDTGNTVHEAALRAVLHPQEDGTNKIISHPMNLSSAILDAHPTKSWILKVEVITEASGHYQRVAIVDCITEEVISAAKIDERNVECGKFIGRMQWLLLGTYNGVIHVYTYEKSGIEIITSFKASDAHSRVRLMVIHPTQPYVLSTSEDRQIKLWKWDVKGIVWMCTKIYDHGHTNDICQVIFNPKDAKSFASASRDRTVKVWSSVSPRSNYTLFGHPTAVTCIDFFTSDDNQYLVSGSVDGFVRIWDLQTRACVHTTELMSPVLFVRSLPDRAHLLIGFEDCTVHLWNYTHFSSERIFNFGACGKTVHSLHLLGPGRFVTHHGGLVSVMNIPAAMNAKKRKMSQ